MQKMINLYCKPLFYLQNLDESFWFTYLPEKQAVYVAFKKYV